MSAPVPGAAALILASASPRRAQLLAQIGVPYRVIPPELDEQRLPGEPAERYVRRLAEAKALKVLRALSAQPALPALPALPVLGADTAVVVDDEVLGKPAGREAALQMLSRLSGRTHVVLSAVALALASGTGVRSALSRSEVRFRPLSRTECAAYWDSGEPRGKAGGYAIQGFGAVFIEALQGSYSGVMGLPLFETAALLAEAGVAVWTGAGGKDLRGGDGCQRQP
ncbi:MAG TPA: Maf family protein [Steroidobacteraceae bacterium]|jgi:septum formation protein|nr:Maf family protein [Steroidobacteraceae bacterium]